MTTVHDFSAKTIDGEEKRLADYKGKTLLIVNVASNCGFTPQYSGLEKLWRERKDDGLVILGFPCNQFGAQEPGDAEEIRNFCSLNYDVTFPLFGKVEVNGDNAHPLYKFLKKEKKGLAGSEAIKWNFTKFVADRSGRVVARFDSKVKPDDTEFVEKVTALLEAQ